MQRKDKKKKQSKLNELLEIPKEISTGEPRVTILGFEQMLIENYKSILEYEEFYIKINTYIGIININGFNLNLNEMNQDDIMITGKIDSVDWEGIED